MKANYLILIFCIIWSNLYADNNIFDTNNISYKIILDESLDGYIDIINQYTEALIDDNYIELILNTELIREPLNTHLLMDFNRFNKYNEFGIYYALGDIDKNGIPELFIGGSYKTEVPRLYDIFVFDKTNRKVIRPFNEIYYDNYGEFGNRTNIYFLYNGIIEVAWTDSGADHGMEFYELSADGYSVELIDSISIYARHAQTRDGREVTKYFHDKEGTIEITEDKFYSILDGYWGEGRSEYWGENPETLSWIEINP